MTNSSSNEERVLQANIAYHSSYARIYDSSQPHFKQENVDRVDRILAELAAKTGGNSLLDLGCGTGFIINIAKKYFRRVVGVDITPAMLEQVDRRGGNVELYLADTKTLPLQDAEFDVCTAYSFLHHLYEFQPTLFEAYRCLRPGGYFYSDQDPNRHYWQLMDNLFSQQKNYHFGEIIDGEVKSVTSYAEITSAETGLSVEDTSFAEYHDSIGRGIEPDSFVLLMKEIGFQNASCRYEWFLGQGKVYHEQSPQHALIIENYLREVLPASRILFKYISFYGEK